MFFRILSILVIPMICSAMTADDMLQKIDEARSFGNEFAFEMTLTSYKSMKENDAYSLFGYVSLDEKKQSSSLIYFNAPQAVEGRKMLMKGADVWMHFPQTRNIIRLTPLQLLLGQVANGDIARISFTTDYTATFDQKFDTDSTEGLVLAIKEKSEGTTYNKIILHVDKKNLRLLDGDFYSSGGKLLKRVKYKGYKKMLGKDFSSVVEIHDGINDETYTVMEYKTVVKKSIPFQYFRSEYLQRFHPVPLN